MASRVAGKIKLQSVQKIMSKNIYKTIYFFTLYIFPITMSSITNHIRNLLWEN